MARVFNRTNVDYVYQGIHTKVTSQKQTICAWVYESTRHAGDPGNTIWDLNSTAGYNEIQSNNGALKIAFNNFGWNSLSQTLALATWAHLATRTDGTNYQFIYNGSPGYQTADSSSMAVYPAAVGSWSTNSELGAPTQATFDGKMAEFAVWNTNLTDNELAALAGGIRPSKVRPQSLISYLPLDGLSSPEPDLSGNARNGTLSGTAYADGPPIRMFTPRWPANTEIPAPSFIPAWAAQSNLPVIGAGTF